MYDYCEGCSKRKFNIIRQVIEERKVDMMSYSNNGMMVEEEQSTFVFLPCEEAIRTGVNGLEETQKVFRLPDNGFPDYYTKIEIVQGATEFAPRIKATTIKPIE